MYLYTMDECQVWCILLQIICHQQLLQETSTQILLTAYGNSKMWVWHLYSLNLSRLIYERCRCRYDKISVMMVASGQRMGCCEHELLDCREQWMICLRKTIPVILIYRININQKYFVIVCCRIYLLKWDKVKTQRSSSFKIIVHLFTRVQSGWY